MSQTSQAPPVTLSQARRIDRLCDEFESAWIDGKRPRLEDFVEQVPDPEREAVLRELLAIEWHHRRRLEEVFSREEYSQRFPLFDFADWEAGQGASPQRGPDGVLPPVHGDGVGDSTILLPHISAPPKSNRYSILRMHARGGMGEIWLANDKDIGRRVAYKRVRAGRDQLEERFFAEAQITGQLEHPGVVPVHELGRDAEGNPFYVMRLVEGRTLKQVIAATHEAMASDPQSRELCLLQLLEIFLALCRTVAYAHHRGVIHRDIKPDNIMIGAFGETLVVDWGLAKILGTTDSPSTLISAVQLSGNRDSTATQDGNVLGSPQYMSPEMAEGRVGEEDIKTDVYLLGATLYEILTNRPPRQGGSKEEILDLARTSPPKPPRQVDPRIPRALEAVCLKAMAREKTARYPSAKELAAEVERYLAGNPVKAYREPWSDRASRWMRRHRQALMRSAVAAVLLLGIAAALVAKRNADEREAASAAQLQRQQQIEQARNDYKKFLELEGKLHYALADTSSLDDRLSFVDPGEVDRLEAEIQKIVARWQPNLEAFPPEAEAEGKVLKKSLAELTLWRVQQEIARPAGAGNSKQLLADLDAIAPLAPSPVSYHRLRSTCLQLAGKSDLAGEALSLSKQSKKSPFDHFLEGEGLRAQSLAQRGDEARGLQQKAIAAYDRCLELDPTKIWAHLQKGRCHLLCEEHDKALAEFNLAVTIQPELPWAWSVRGFAQAILRNYPAAEHDLEYALQFDPQFAQARLSRGAVHLLRNDVAAARKEFELVAKYHPGNLQASYYLALAEQASGNHAAALRQCAAILEARPDLAPPRLLSVQAHLAQGHADESLADLNLWLAHTEPNLNPTSPEASARRCHILHLLAMRQGGSASRIGLPLALREGQAAVAAKPALAQAYADLAEVLFTLGEGKQAIAVLEKGLRCRDSDLTLARLRLGRGLALVGQADNARAKKDDAGAKEDYARAKEDYSIAAGVSGGEPTAQVVRAMAHAMLGYIAARQSKPEEAQRQAALSMSQLLDHNNFKVWINLACVYNALADAQASDTKSLQDTAMAMLANAMFQAKRAGSTQQATQEILGDDALKSLQGRPDFDEKVLKN